ncbi:TIGR00303 family protein [Microcoleus sp. FACHB-1515]|uniref:nicotinate mononucleotide-dependent phosphoribosyltransferase CobT n=1 Tax=Cyanophyceae TaxID=3028117 RepID=UPI001685CD2D|nr:TIGR00303 family protein [Microcoleus sp. FACHB-1515]MBD2093121.1 TIGR00303 family protein [Microcoleus sp. FACHB-1515]
MIGIYSQPQLCQAWIDRFCSMQPYFACVLGFTDTGLIPHISAAGRTPRDRQFTALADAEFLYGGVQPHPRYPLPPLTAGASPTLISRAIAQSQAIPVQLFNAGLRLAPSVPCIDLGGEAANCVSTGKAIDLATVEHLLQQGLRWGEAIAAQTDYLILGECVVGGTTTALAVLTGLGWDAAGKVNSSHPHCNHSQKWDIVQAGLQQLPAGSDPLKVVAAVGDPMQIAVAGMAIAASRSIGVLLAGGTQMLAVYALLRAIAHCRSLAWQGDRVVVGTTRWVAEDPTGDTVGLAKLLDAPLVATRLSFANSRFDQLRAYEQGFVKEGVGAGGMAIAAHLYQGWQQTELLQAIEALAAEYAERHG